MKGIRKDPLMVKNLRLKITQFEKTDLFDVCFGKGKKHVSTERIQKIVLQVEED